MIMSLSYRARVVDMLLSAGLCSVEAEWFLCKEAIVSSCTVLSRFRDEEQVIFLDIVSPETYCWWGVDG